MRLLFPIFFLILLAACKEISFEIPQPAGKKALTSVPKTLRGRYLVRTAEGDLSKDTVIITANGYRFGYYDAAERAAHNDEYERGILSDSLVLKNYKGYYFLNLNENPEWILRVLKQEKNGDILYMTMEEKNTDFNIYMKKLSAEISIDSLTTASETLYQINPTANQLVELIRKGFFSESKLVRIK
jgi:hypothetical protein